MSNYLSEKSREMIELEHRLNEVKRAILEEVIEKQMFDLIKVNWSRIRHIGQN